MQCPWTGGKGRFYGEAVKLSVPDRENRDNSRRIKGQTQVGPVSVLRGYLLTWLRRVGSVLRICKRKKRTTAFQQSFLGGGRWIRTTEVSDNRFTVCPLWPLGNSPICKAYCLNSRLILELVDGLEPPTC